MHHRLVPVCPVGRRVAGQTKENWEGALLLTVEGDEFGQGPESRLQVGALDLEPSIASADQKVSHCTITPATRTYSIKTNEG